MNGSRRVSVVLVGILLVSAMVLAGCQEAASSVVIEHAIRAWAGGPPDGSEVSGEVSVMCHAFARGGVSQIELYVNSAFANRAANPDPGNEYFTARLTFETTGPGSYVVHCRTYDQASGMVQSDPLTLRVTGEEPTPTTAAEIPTATPTSTEVPPTEVPPTPTPPPPTGTSVPPTATRIPPTATRIPPTSTPTTPPRPTIQSLEANPPQINKGSCFRASWAVVGVISAVYFDGEGVGDHDFRDKCPGTTTTYTLRAVGPGGEATENVTVVVIQVSPTPDTVGPNITDVQQTETTVYCQSEPDTLDISARVTDPSGVASVQLYCTAVGAEQPERFCGDFARNGNVWQLTYNAPLWKICSGTIQYRIKATDGSPLQNVSWWGTGSFAVWVAIIR